MHCFHQLYCCPQYERLVKFELAQRGDTAHLADEMIDIKPHPPYGTKAARRAAKERAAERAREREMERQRAAGANPTNFYACKWHKSNIFRAHFDWVSKIKVITTFDLCTCSTGEKGRESEWRFVGSETEHRGRFGSTRPKLLFSFRPTVTIAPLTYTLCFTYIMLGMGYPINQSEERKRLALAQTGWSAGKRMWPNCDWCYFKSDWLRG